MLGGSSCCLRLDGFSYAILAFALERFSIFRGLFDRPSEFPLFLGWMRATSAKFKDTQNVSLVQTYKERLQSLTKEDSSYCCSGLQPAYLLRCTALEIYMKK